MTLTEMLINYFYGTETDAIPAPIEYTPLPEPPRNYTIYSDDDVAQFKTVTVGVMLEERHTDITINVNERVYSDNL